MKLIIVVNNATDSFETCILSRELSVEEVVALNDLVGHGHTHTLHIAECGDKAIPFLDIVEELKKIPSPDQANEKPLGSGKVHNLRGVPTKHIKK